MSDPATLPHLTPAEARILGCLAEKKELTPDVYPLTLNAVHAAANQKTAREPVMALETVEVSRALAALEQKGLVRQAFASRVDRYEHLLAQKFALTQNQIALLALMLLRGPQTAHELLARSERMARYGSADDLRSDLDLMIGRRPPLVQLIERGPGQREDRYAHLLAGPVDVQPSREPMRFAPAVSDTALEARVRALEEQVSALAEQVRRLSGDA